MAIDHGHDKGPQSSGFVAAMEAAPDAAPDAEDEDEEKVCRFCLCGEEEDDGPENGALLSASAVTVGSSAVTVGSSAEADRSP